MRETRPDRADLGAGLFVVGLGVVGVWQALVIPVSPIHAQVGPKLVPWLVALGLLGLGALLSLVAWRGGWTATLQEVEQAPPANPRAIGLLLAALLTNMVLIGPLGFTVAATAQFVLVAAAFGSRAHLRNLVIAFAVSLSAYTMFVQVLGVNIGAGVVEALVFGAPP